MWAAKRGDMSVVSVLIEGEANLEARDQVHPWQKRSDLCPSPNGPFIRASGWSLIALLCRKLYNDHLLLPYVIFPSWHVGRSTTATTTSREFSRTLVPISEALPR